MNDRTEHSTDLDARLHGPGPLGSDVENRCGGCNEPWPCSAAKSAKGSVGPLVSKTVEERLRSLADSIESESECQHASEVYDALMLGAKALDLLVSQFYVQHIGMCEWNRPYPTGTEPRCTCGLREILHGEVRPQDKPHIIDGREGECWCGPHIVHVTGP